MVEEAIQSEYVVHSLYSTDDSFAKKHPNAHLVSTKEMEQMSALNSSSAYLIVLHFPDKSVSEKISGAVIVLDGIADPGNMGTIIRSVEWFGIAHLFCTVDCVELYNPKVVQSTMGSIFRMDVRYLETAQIGTVLNENGYAIVGAEMNGMALFDFVFKGKTAIVIGSESHGIRHEMKKVLSASITIPGAGKAESLNAATACSVILAEYFRQLHLG